MIRKDFEIEICAGNIESVLAADEGGADRVELCENLFEGGTTPSIGTIALSKEKCSLDVFVIFRPRGGDFVYSEIEFEVMRKDILSAVETGADGIVIGCLKPDGRIDVEETSRLMEAAKGLPVTFHRAFDVTPDPLEALDTIKSLGIMAGSGIDELNIQEIATSTGVTSFHATLREDVRARSSIIRNEVDFNCYKISSASRIKKMIKILEDL